MADTGLSPPVLAPHYYRDNFFRLCETVERRYGDLLSLAERDWLHRVRRLPFSAQCLYVRLVSRVGPWFRRDRLDYPEIESLEEALEALLDAHLAEVAAELSASELGALYSRDELVCCFPQLLSGRRPVSKAGLVALIEQSNADEAELLRTIQRRLPGAVITPVGADEVGLYQLLFFGNRRQSLTEFVLSDLGLTRHYPYSLDAETRAFPHREALDEYLRVSEIADRHRELLEAGEPEALAGLAPELLEQCPESPIGVKRWYRQRNALARDLEREGELDWARALYAGSRRHPARERLVRVMERCGEWDQALSQCREIIENPWCEDELEAAGRIIPRLQRALGQEVTPRQPDHFPRIDLRLRQSPEALELQVAADLAVRWRSVHYVENSLMNAMFGLAFWEQIFAAVPGAFHHPFQDVPADMYEPGFRTCRQGLLDDRLAYLRSADLQRELLAAFDRYHSLQCRWVNWRDLDRGLVARAAAIIPREHLTAIWERMLFDPRENRRGFPDLLALGETEGEYCLIEVKGPGDTLQNSQKRWLRYFAGHQIPATVAWVQWDG